MQLAQRYAPLTSLASLNEVQQVVAQHLCHDWVVRIEHADQAAVELNSWNQWDKAMFALRNVEPVIDAILSCRVNHPGHAIRLNAEKMRPQTRMIYWVYLPEFDALQQESRQPASNSTSPMPDKWWQIPSNKSQTMPGTKWRTLALVGMLTASVVLLQESIIA